MRKGPVKFYILFAVAALLPLLVGAKFYDVELRGAEQPLIDLSVLLSDGGTYLPNDMAAVAEELASGAFTDGEEPDADLLVRVRGTTVFLNGTPCVGRPFSELFTEEYTAGERVVLADDYASYRTLKEIISLLDEWGVAYTVQTLR